MILEYVDLPPEKTVRSLKKSSELDTPTACWTFSYTCPYESFLRDLRLQYTCFGEWSSSAPVSQLHV